MGARPRRDSALARYTGGQPPGGDPADADAGGRARRSGYRARSSGTRLLEYALIAVIFLGSLALWIAVPLGSLWLASLVGDDATTVVLAVLVICPLAMIASSLVLTSIYRVYLRVSGAGQAQTRTAWLKSLSGERGRRPPRGVLDACLTISAMIALALLTVWFFFFAENSMPAGPVP